MIQNGLMLKIERSIQKTVLSDLKKKIVLIVGPRQVGKTTFSKNLLKSFDYLNYDSDKDKLNILEQNWNRDAKLVIFDEIHKMRNWKRWLKGIYDTNTESQKILVTGSARLDTAKKMGDSLAGRHFTFNLLPLDLKELKKISTPEKNFEQLMKFSGFPEPFLEASERFHLNWQKSHTDLILRQDMVSYENIRDIGSIELLTALLRKRVAAPFSYNSIATDLQRDPKTILKWVGFLENLFIVFKVKPYSKNIARSVLKEPKYYFYDYTRIDNNPGAQLENFVALSLKKEVHYLNEVLGIESELYYLKQKGAKEIDFFIQRKNLPPVLIEVKMSETEVSSAFNVFNKFFTHAVKIQLVQNIKKEFSDKTGVHVYNAVQYLAHFDLSLAKTLA